MYPKLYNRSGQLQAVLDNIINDTAVIKRVVNGEFTFSFDAFEKELKSEYFDSDNCLLIDEQTFDIKYMQQTHDTEVKYSIQCEHVNYRMEDGEENLFVSYAYTGTPTQILANMLSGTEFSVGTVDFTDVITVSVNSEVTRKSLIYQLANLLGGEVDYTDKGFTINILATIGQNRGFQVRFGKNLKGITKTIDRRGGLKTYYEVDMLELKNSNEYIEKQLQDLEIVGAGDTIRIIDEVIKIDVENRVISMEYNPLFAINTKLEIANTIELITDKINQIETRSVQQDRLYNNVAISQEYGFRATRSDRRARATLGGGTLSLDVGDGDDNYAPAIYFDAATQKYKVIGDIVMEKGSISWGDVNPPSAENVGAISNTFINEDGIFTKQVYATNISVLNGKIQAAQIDKLYAEQIDVTNGKIKAAQIETLEVGTNVNMGPNASISWLRVTDQPTIPSQYTDAQALSAWVASGYKTYIDGNGVYTGKLYAQHAIVNNGQGTGSINMDLGNSNYVLFQTQNIAVAGGTDQTLLIGKATSPGVYNNKLNRIDMFTQWLNLYGSLYLSGKLSPYGEVDLSHATGINWGTHAPTAKFA